MLLNQICQLKIEAEMIVQLSGLTNHDGPRPCPLFGAHSNRLILDSVAGLSVVPFCREGSCLCSFWVCKLVTVSHSHFVLQHFYYLSF